MTQVSSLYLHVPFCKHLCNYCDFYKRKLDLSTDQFEGFHQFLSDSVIEHEKFMHTHGVKWNELDTLYLGGGTPSLWGSRGASFLQNLLPVKLASNVEFTMEIDPGTWTTEMLKAWKDIGLNRISIGTQSLNPEFLKVIDRVHSLEDSLNFLNLMDKENWNYSLDFLLGIPYSKVNNRNIKEELDLLLNYNPKHISLYILNARSRYPHIQEMPDDEYIRDEYLFVSEYLRSKGFHHYEVSNFALPGFESRHNQKYWRGENVAAFGPTGTGYLGLSENQALRYKWKVSEALFEVEELGPSEIKLENYYLSLRTSEGIPVSWVTETLSNDWVQKGYTSIENQKVKLTSLGYLMLDSLMDDLFKTGI